MSQTKPYQITSNLWFSGYTFSAKEKDEETGYCYFGARYYDSDISVWLSVDPMSDLYPNWSPYNYCLQNPIKFVDPNGMKSVESKDRLNVFQQMGNWFAGNCWKNTANKIISRTQGITHVELSKDGKTLTAYGSNHWSGTNENGAVSGVSTFELVFNSCGYTTTIQSSRTQKEFSTFTKWNTLIKGQYNSSWKNLKMHIGNFDRHFDGDHWSNTTKKTFGNIVESALSLHPFGFTIDIKKLVENRNIHGDELSSSEFLESVGSVLTAGIPQKYRTTIRILSNMLKPKEAK